MNLMRSIAFIAAFGLLAACGAGSGRGSIALAWRDLDGRTRLRLRDAPGRGRRRTPRRTTSAHRWRDRDATRRADAASLHDRDERATREGRLADQPSAKHNRHASTRI